MMEFNKYTDEELERIAFELKCEIDYRKDRQKERQELWSDICNLLENYQENFGPIIFAFDEERISFSEDKLGKFYNID